MIIFRKNFFLNVEVSTTADPGTQIRQVLATDRDSQNNYGTVSSDSLCCVDEDKPFFHCLYRLGTGWVKVAVQNLKLKVKLDMLSHVEHLKMTMEGHLKLRYDQHTFTVMIYVDVKKLL